MSSEVKTVEGVSSRTDSNDGPQTVEVDGKTYEYDAEEPYQDAELLQTLYWEKGMTLYGVGDAVGCSHATVGRWMKKLDIDVRASPAERPPHFGQKDGYEYWEHTIDGKWHNVPVHRLLAVAEYGFDAVCGNDVHHQNHIPWDNRPDNIELKSPEQHRRDHNDERFGHEQAPWRNEDNLRELYVEKQMSERKIADEWGCSRSTVRWWLDKHGIEKRSQSEANQLAQTDDNQQTLTEAE